MPTACPPAYLERLAEVADAAEADWEQARRRLRAIKAAGRRAFRDLSTPPSRGVARWSRISDLEYRQEQRVALLDRRAIRAAEQYRRAAESV